MLICMHYFNLQKKSGEKFGLFYILVSCIVNLQNTTIMKRLIFILLFIASFIFCFPQKNDHKPTGYIFPEFSKGVVLMKSGVKHQKMLNYNMLTEEMVFTDNGKKLAFSDYEMQRVDTVYLADRKFIVMDKIWLELLYRSDFSLFAQHRCHLKDPGKPAGYGGTSQTQASDSYSSLITAGAVYELELPDDYGTSPYKIYTLMKNGETIKFVSMRQLKKYYEEKKDLVNTYIKEKDIEFNNPDDILELIKYMEGS